jgi:hypothetical protein
MMSDALPSAITRAAACTRRATDVAGQQLDLPDPDWQPDLVGNVSDRCGGFPAMCYC